MSFGIGLGAFVDSFQRSAQLGIKLRETRQANARRDQVKQITADAKAKFGDVLSDDAYNYMMRRQEALYMENGELDKARAIKDWSEKDEAKKGTKLFASIGAALNAGDYETAAKLGNDLSGLDGYGPSGDYHFEYTNHPTQGPGFYVKSSGGEAFVPQNNALPFFTRHFNPQAAAEWQTQQSKESKDLEKEAQEIRADAIKSLEKQYDGGLAGDELAFKDMEDSERERLINKYAKERIAPGRRKKFASYFGDDQTEDTKGAKESAPSAPGVIVDQNTGERVNPPRAREQEQAPGSDGSIVKNDLPPMEGIGGVPAPTAGPGSTTAPSETPARENMKLVDAVTSAEEEMRKTGDVHRAAATLKSAGVPERAWPASIRRGLRDQESPGISAGPSRRPAIKRDAAVGVPVQIQRPR
jgi:hypothetical protein